MNRNKTLYFFLSLTLFCLLLQGFGDAEFVSTASVSSNKNFSLEEAKSFFEGQTESHVMTRSVSVDVDRSISPGAFSVQWSAAVASAKKDIECYDIPISTTLQYKAISVQYRNAKAEAGAGTVYQKLIVVKDVKKGTLGQYILTLIPSKEYDEKHRGEVSDRFINCADKGGFTGVAIYSIPYSNVTARVNTYKNGSGPKEYFF